jgi:hypothetical protein
MAKRSGPKGAAGPAALLARAIETIEQDGAVARSSLGPPAGRDGLFEELRRRGYEMGKRFVRVPVAEQLEAALREGRYLGLKTLGAHVRGATATEARAVARQLANAGRAHLVLRSRSEALVPSTEDVLEGKELEGAAARVVEFAKVLHAASKKDLRVLRSDARDLLDRILESRCAPATKGASGLELPRLLSAIDRVRDSSGLAFVPKVVSSLAPDVDRETAKAALLEAESRGLLELRPETGLGRLSEAELLLCPEGAQGTRLSWARRKEVGT